MMFHYKILQIPHIFPHTQIPSQCRAWLKTAEMWAAAGDHKMAEQQAGGALGKPAQGYDEQGRQAALLKAGWSTGAQEIIHGIDQSSPQHCEIDRCEHNVLV